MIEPSRQGRRAQERAAQKTSSRRPQARASWGDRRLNRRCRFAFWALQRRIRTLGALTEFQAKRLALEYGLPFWIVAEAAAGLLGLLLANAA